MTLQQMRYVIAVAESGSFSKAAEVLFISQPSLSTAIYKLEKELGVSLFIRTAKGVEISSEGHAFIEAARRIVKQSDAVLHHYSAIKEGPSISLRISSIPAGYAFRVFTKLFRSVESSRYDLCFLDRKSQQVIRDLARQYSEVGVVDISTANHDSIFRMLRRNQLEFKPVVVVKPYVLIRKEHPLANRAKVMLSEFNQYPFVFYEMDTRDTQDYINDFILKNHAPQKQLRGKDRSTLVSLLRSTDGYAICNGLMDEELYSGLTTVLLEDVDDHIEIGWVKRKGVSLSALAQQYVTLFEEEVFQLATQNGVGRSVI